MTAHKRVAPATVKLNGVTRLLGSMSNGDQRSGESAFVYDVSPEESLSDGVVRAVATVADSDPAPDPSSAAESGRELDPLYDAVDPDALDAVFRTAGPDAARTRGRVTFSYFGYEVSVHGEGRISVERPDETGD